LDAIEIASSRHPEGFHGIKIPPRRLKPDILQALVAQALKAGAGMARIGTLAAGQPNGNERGKSRDYEREDGHGTAPSLSPAWTLLAEYRKGCDPRHSKIVFAAKPMGGRIIGGGIGYIRLNAVYGCEAKKTRSIRKE
jgi:hypothetical protein